ncbi:MAG: hypothetical protein B6U97_04905 [Candidatus Altiarchaeales archaeon ex4484_96]|nr:MAG: hypothetical protein B6U97_04905 [Candidatus Altiarchaeales archaeon ex4484_96]
MPVCNYCGKEIKSEHGLAIHIAKVHGKKRIGNKKHKTILISASKRDLERWRELARKRKTTISGPVRNTMFNEIECENIGYSNLKTLKDETLNYDKN